MRRVLSVGSAVAVLLACQRGPAPFSQLDDARSRTADARVQFNKAADASNRSVMADTDEASIAFARDAEQATGVVESDAAALAPLLKNLGLQGELGLLDEFGKHFSEYRKLDRSILALAVENTNLKAQRLSFGPARDAADRFRASLDAIASGASSKDRCRIEELVAKAVVAVREIQVLQAPHIAEPDDAAMTRLERDMAERQTTTKTALSELSQLIDAKARPSLDAAQAALAQFDGVSQQIVALSRRNTNVRSLDLALRTKPPLTAACDDSLRALQAALANAGSKATR